MLLLDTSKTNTGVSQGVPTSWQHSKKERSQLWEMPSTPVRVPWMTATSARSSFLANEPNRRPVHPTASPPAQGTCLHSAAASRRPAGGRPAASRRRAAALAGSSSGPGADSDPGPAKRESRAGSGPVQPSEEERSRAEPSAAERSRAQPVRGLAPDGGYLRRHGNSWDSRFSTEPTGEDCRLQMGRAQSLHESQSQRRSWCVQSPLQSEFDAPGPVLL